MAQIIGFTHCNPEWATGHSDIPWTFPRTLSPRQKLPHPKIHYPNNHPSPKNFTSNISPSSNIPSDISPSQFTSWLAHGLIVIR